MIDYIKGKVDRLETTEVVLEAFGVGYSLQISLNTYSALRGQSDIRLYVYEQVRQDAATMLYGFSSCDERDIFMLLLGVSGVGGATARAVISAYSPSELQDIISSEDTRALKSVKGIGQKAAERIIVELRDKVLSLGVSGGSSNDIGDGITIGAKKELSNEAISALTMLGYSSQQAHKAVSSIIKAEPDLPVEQVIKKALKAL